MVPPKHNFEKSKIHAYVSGVLVSGTVIFIVQSVGGGDTKETLSPTSGL